MGKETRCERRAADGQGGHVAAQSISVAGASKCASYHGRTSGARPSAPEPRQGGRLYTVSRG